MVFFIIVEMIYERLFKIPPKSYINTAENVIFGRYWYMQPGSGRPSIRTVRNIVREHL